MNTHAHDRQVNVQRQCTDDHGRHLNRHELTADQERHQAAPAERSGCWKKTRCISAADLGWLKK